MQISHNGLLEIESSEGFSSKPYWDSIGKVWTIGFGETDGITQNTPSITRAEAESRLKSRFNKDYAYALKPFINLSGFNQNRYDALASFIWNCGVGAVGPNTKVGKALRARKWSTAANALLEWDNGPNGYVEGLHLRRVRERTLFLKSVSSPVKLEQSEKDHIKILESERRSAKRHGGWSHIAKSHNTNAVNAKNWLIARVKAIPGSKPSTRPARRAEMNKVINNS